MRENRPVKINIRVTEQDSQRLAQEARREGLDASTFVRMALRRELTQRELRAPSGPLVAA